MGTNYYHHESGERTCPHCGQETPGRHVGKSSYGWAFSLHVYPADGIHSLDDWRKVWEAGGAIFDECGDRVTPAEMLATVAERSMSSGKPLRRHTPGEWGMDVRPGPGTWDLCNYEFS